MLSFWIAATYALFVEIFGQPQATPTSQSSLALIRTSIREPIEPTGNRPYPPIHILHDDDLLNIFHLYRPDVPDECNGGDRSRQRWWYKLARVCRRWRYLILASPSQLHLHLICTNGVPIANMLAHSPPLPLTIYYREGGRETTQEDEEGILLALKHSDRVHYMSLFLPTRKLQKIIATMDEQFPILERLYIVSGTVGDRSLVLPRTFQAPHLRHLFLWPAALPIGAQLLLNTVGLVTLTLLDIPPSAYFSPNYLLTRLSLMPQLEILAIHFHSPPSLPNRYVENQPSDTPMNHITLSNLRQFSFKGVSAYLEGLLAHISAPILSNLHMVLCNQLTLTVPHLLQFMDTAPSFSAVRLAFDNDLAGLEAYQLRGRRSYRFKVQIMCRHLVASVVQILGTLQPVLSVVDKLTISHGEPNLLSEWHNEVDRTLWRQLLIPFSNLKTLHVQNELAGKLARSLQTDGGKSPLRLLPNLKEVGYSGGCDNRDAFTPFINKRREVGHPVSLSMVDDSVFSQPWLW